MSTSLLNQNQIRGEFFKRIENAPSWTGLVALEVPTLGGNPDTFGFLDSAPAATKWQGPRRIKDVVGRQISVYRDRYESSIQIKADDLMRDQTGACQRSAAQLADRMLSLHHKLISKLIEEGDTATYGTAYDGQYFFDTDHSLGASGTQKNLLTSSEVASLNVATAASPTPEEMAPAIVDVIGYAKTMKDDEGEPMHELATEWTVMVPSNMWGAAHTAVQANVLSGNKTNPIKAMTEAGLVSIKVVENPRLNADSAIFYVFRSDMGNSPPFIICTEEMNADQFIGEGSEFFFKNRAYLFGADESVGVMYGEPLAAFRCVLS